MSIKLNNFVNIDIKYDTLNSYVSTRDTAVLVLFDDTTTLDDFDTTFESKEDLEDHNPIIYKAYQIYFDSYFDNLGKKLRVILKTSKPLANVTDEDLLSIIKTLEDKYVIVDSNLSYKIMQSVGRKYAQKTGTEQKLILGYCPNDTYIFDEDKKEYISANIDKFCVKYGNESYDSVIPAEVDEVTATSQAIPCVSVLKQNHIICEATPTSDATALEGKIYASRSAEPDPGANPGYMVDKNGYKYTNLELETGDAVPANSYEITKVGNDGDVDEDNFTDYYEIADQEVHVAGRLVDASGHLYKQPEAGTYDEDTAYYSMTNLGADENTAREGVIYCTRKVATTEVGYLKDGAWEYEIYPTEANITPIHTSSLNTYIASEVGRDYKENNNYKGIEMSIAAYLTNIDITRYDSVRDYDFTAEEYSKDILKVIEVSDNSLASSLIKTNYNFVGNLLNVYRNIGGNDSKGHSIINTFMLICLHQTLTERLTELLTTNIKYNQSGLAQISAVLNKELQKYVDNGYLTTNKTWNQEDLYYKGILIVKKNTPLLLGYKYVILPFSTLTDDEKDENALPDIYILIADSYGIRKINIFGKTY